MHLAVDERNSACLEFPHQHDQCHLGGIALTREHRFAVEHAADGDTVEPAHQTVVTPRLDGVSVAALMQNRVCLDHLRRALHLFGRALCDHASEVEAIDHVGQPHDERHVVLDQKDRRAELVADATEQRAERFRFLLRDAAGRLVEQDQSRLQHQQTGELGHAQRPVAQIADVAVLVRMQVDDLHDLVRALARRALAVRAPGQA